MITNQQMMEATKLPAVQEISFDAFDEHDFVNLIMQRSEIIHDQPRSNRVIRAWSTGNADPALSLVRDRGVELARRAAAIIYLEYLQIRDVINAVAPSSVADIGCGYAIFDLFLWRDHGCRLRLIDLETTDDRHFGYRQNGAAYSNLEVAGSFLTQNGVSPDAIERRNPAKDDLTSEASVDLALSFISCGYHYPAQTYDDFFRHNVSDKGAIILDLRAQKLGQGTEFLQSIGTVSVLVDAAAGSAKRVLVRKSS